MQALIKTGRIFYAVSLALVGIHQLFYADFCTFLFPPWPNPVPGYGVLAIVFNVLLIVASLAIILQKNARNISLVLGCVLLLIILFAYVPYEYIAVPYSKTNLGLWTGALKELALAGGAFAIAGTFPVEGGNTQSQSVRIRLMEKLIPAGRYFFAIMLVCFGIDHFLYPQFVAGLVPGWIPNATFWSYFGGVALIAGGIGIATGLWLRTTALLTGIMILIWFVILHTPRAIAQPLADKGNEIVSALSALAFTGIAFVIAGSAKSGRNA